MGDLFGLIRSVLALYAASPSYEETFCPSRIVPRQAPVS